MTKRGLFTAIFLTSVGALAIATVGAGTSEALPETDAPTATYICTPSHVGAFSNRVHVLCTAPAPGGIFYFAAPVTDAAAAARFLSLFETAKAIGKNLQLYYDPADTSGTAFGCGAADCRAVTAVEITL